LHKVRYGRYPDSLRDLKFAGEWDQVALMSVRYYPRPNRDAYISRLSVAGWANQNSPCLPSFGKALGIRRRYSPRANERPNQSMKPTAGPLRGKIEG